MRRFLRFTEEHPALLSDSWRMLICFSYYCADDLTQWTETLARLNDKIKANCTCRPTWSSGNVLLMGSPIYFPNYKIPFLFQDVGLHIADHMDYTTQKAKVALTIEETANITMSNLAKRVYQSDCSGSYAKNECLQASRNTPIYMQILFNVLMGLRRQEINAVNYSDIDYINRTLSVERQLGKKLNREPKGTDEK